jgi:hypothetical protein
MSEEKRMEISDIVVSKAEVSTFLFVSRDARCPFHARNPRYKSRTQFFYSGAFQITRSAPSWFRYVLGKE